MKTLGKIFQVSFFVYPVIHLCVLICKLFGVLDELSWVISTQRVKLNSEGEAATMKHTINNSDDNVCTSPDSSPKSPRVQPFDANPPYSQVPTIF